MFARDGASGRGHREIADEWIAALGRAGLPLPRGPGRPRPPLTFAAPMPAGMAAERELADLSLAERLTIDRVRAALAPTLPAEIELVDLFDVWLGAPAVQALLVAADYRVELVGSPDVELLSRASARLLSARTLERSRPRGGGSVRYDLRPLLQDLLVEPGRPVALLITTRFHPERGAGRPEEVFAALEQELGERLEVGRTVRKRLILEGEQAGGDEISTAASASPRRK